MHERAASAGFIAIPVFIKLWAGEDCSTPAQNCKNISFYAYRRLFAFPYISVTVASLCKSPLLRSGGWEAGSSDNMHSGDSLQEALQSHGARSFFANFHFRSGTDYKTVSRPHEAALV